MHHKFYKDCTLNILNYMSSYHGTERSFIGFMKLQGNTYYGAYLDDIPIVAVYKYMHPTYHQISDDIAELSYTQEYPWVLFFHGSDNTSYIKRFISEKEMEEWFNKTEAFDSNRELMVFWYNS